MALGNIALGIFSIIKESKNDLKKHLKLKATEELLDDNIVTREEFDVLRDEVLKLREELKNVKK